MFSLSYSVTHGFVLDLYPLVVCWWNFQTEDIYSIVIHPVGCFIGCIEKPGFGAMLLAVFSEG